MPIDYKKYPPNWNTEIRPRILKRAKNKCEICGVLNYSIVNRTWKNGKKNKTRIILTIAHLDHDPENWNVKDNRLRALCQKCHLSLDVKNKFVKLKDNA